MEPKAKHGGKRKGAGRPTNPNSIRSQLAKATAGKYKHSRTLYQIWTGEFLAKNLDDDVLRLLYMARDKSTRALDTNGEHRTFISRHKTLVLCKLAPSIRADFMYEPLMKFIKQYKDEHGLLGDWSRKIAKQLDSD